MIAVASAFAVILMSCSSGGGGGVIDPDPADVVGDWLITRTVNSGSTVCTFGVTSATSGERFNLMGSEVFGGHGVNCIQGSWGTLSGNTLTLQDTYFATGACSYKQTYNHAITFTGSTLSGTYHLERTNVSGNCSNLFPLLARCVEDGSFSGSRCNGCSGCP